MKLLRTIRLDQPFRAVEIRDRESPHLRAHLVAFPHRYFARLDAAGNFAIPDVPAGRWQIRVCIATAGSRCARPPSR